MKKIILTTLILVLTMVSVKAQTFGAKAGLNVANLAGDVTDNKALLGVTIGAFTEFELSDLKINSTELTAKGNIQLSVKVKNTGNRIGKEVIQVYINDKISSVATPVKVLKGFEKIELEPSEAKTVSIEIAYHELGLWDRNMNYVVEPGEFEIMVGNSSGNISLMETIVIK